jgi:hypothetical protein
MVAMIRPLLPLIEYYSNYDYIVKELCINRDKPYLKCNGTCYLYSIIEKANLPNKENSHPAILINLSDYPISTLDFESFSINHFNFSNPLDNPDYLTQFQPEDYKNLLLRPPIHLSFFIRFC